jgi:hypothetical protein
MMLGFGIFLILDPHVLSNIFVAIGLIGGAVIISVALERVKKGWRAEKASEVSKAPESKAPEKKPKKAKKRGTAKKPKV